MAFGKRVPSPVLLAEPSDSPGYVRLILRAPIGHRQASDLVVAKRGDEEFQFFLHAQDELDVPAGSTVTFPDGSTFKTPAHD